MPALAQYQIVQLYKSKGLEPLVALYLLKNVSTNDNVDLNATLQDFSSVEYVIARYLTGTNRGTASSPGISGTPATLITFSQASLVNDNILLLAVGASHY